MLKFPVPTTPIADESLIGFIARASDRNGHPFIRNVLALAGLSKEKLLSESNVIDVGRSAEFFGCSPDDFGMRLDFTVLESGGAGTVNVLGSPVRSQFRDETVRRVSPASLRVSAHHRASWLLKPLLYCPESGELLIDKCPACKRALGWVRTTGISFCEYCLNEDYESQTDLRGHSVSRLVGEELKTYRAIAQLITHPSAIADRIPPAFMGWRAWEIFDFVVLIATILSKRNEGRIRLNKHGAMKLDDWHENFMIAGRAIFTWPHGFYDIIEIVRNSVHNRLAKAGRAKEIGALAYNFRRSFNASSRASDLIEKTVDAFLLQTGSFFPKIERPGKPGKPISPVPTASWIPLKAALLKYKADDKWVHRLIKAGDIEVRWAKKRSGQPCTHLNSLQLEQILEEKRTLVPLTALSQKTGFPMSTILGLSSSGHIKLATGPAARLRLPSVSDAEATRFLDVLIDRACEAEAEQVPLFSTLQRRGAANRLLDVLRRCLDGGLRFSLLTGSQPILKKLMVSKIELQSVLSNDSHNEAISLERMTRRDAAIYLGVSAHDISTLVRPGYLEEVPGFSCHLSGASVKRFASKLISSRMVAKHLGISVRAISKEMKSRKIRPALSYRTQNQTTSHIWRRADLEFLSEQIA